MELRGGPPLAGPASQWSVFGHSTGTGRSPATPLQGGIPPGS